MSDPSTPLHPALQSRALWTALAALSALPVLLSPLVMLPDLFNHIGRYHVMIHGREDPFLASYYAFDWRLVGNLGLDLPMLLLGPWLGTELAARLLVAAIPPLHVIAIARLSRAAHGVIQPSAMMALPLIYSFPFLHGFVNFALGFALALLAVPIWLRISGASAIVRIAGISVMAFAIWLAHVAGWAVFAILAASWALAEAIAQRGIMPSAIGETIARTWPVGLPILPTLLWRSEQGAETGMYSLSQKAHGVANLLRGENLAFDIVSVALLLGCVAWLLIDRRVTKQWPLLLGGLILTACVAILPSYVFGSFYADIRLVPVALTALILSAGVMPFRPGHFLAVCGLALFVARLSVHGWGWHERGQRVAEDLRALDAVPQGARIAVIAERTLCRGWTLTGIDRVPSLAIVRKSAFVNTQWDMAGQQLMVPIYNRASGYHAAPSALLATPGKACEGRPMADILAGMPHAGFDYVWVFSPPDADSRTPWLSLVRTTPGSRLYLIRRRRA